MRSVEGEGNTIDEAIAHALAALGVAREEVEISIIENASRGLLGIGRKKARVRATIRPPLHAWLEADRESPLDPSDVSAPRDIGLERGAKRPQGRSRRGRAEPWAGKQDAHASAPEHAGAMRVGGASGGTHAPASRTPSPDAHAGAAAFDGTAVLGEILRRMAIDATVTRATENALSIEGPASVQAVGRRGEVLDALEYLLNRIAERGGRTAARVVLDADGYRAKRKTSLEELARRLAERARRRRKPVTLNPLNPADRRTVYLALQAENGVLAKSIGQGFYRKLVIIPEGVRRGGGKAGS